MSNNDSSKQDIPIFTRKLKQLFREVRDAAGEEYSPADIQVASGGALTASYIWRLLSGTAANPSYNIIKVLSHFFEVDPSYFFDEDETSELIIRPRKQKLLAEINQAAMRLDEEGLQRLIEMVRYINHLRANVPQEEEPPANVATSE